MDPILSSIAGSSCGLCLVVASTCPQRSVAASLPRCADAAVAELCLAHGECGTNASLNNCHGSLHVYYRQECPHLPSGPPPSPRAWSLHPPGVSLGLGISPPVSPPLMMLTPGQVAAEVRASAVPTCDPGVTDDDAAVRLRSAGLIRSCAHALAVWSGASGGADGCATLQMFGLCEGLRRSSISTAGAFAFAAAAMCRAVPAGEALALCPVTCRVCSPPPRHTTLPLGSNPRGPNGAAADIVGGGADAVSDNAKVDAEAHVNADADVDADADACADSELRLGNGSAPLSCALIECAARAVGYSCAAHPKPPLDLELEVSAGGSVQGVPHRSVRVPFGLMRVACPVTCGDCDAASDARTVSSVPLPNLRCAQELRQFAPVAVRGIVSAHMNPNVRHEADATLSSSQSGSASASASASPSVSPLASAASASASTSTSARTEVAEAVSKTEDAAALLGECDPLLGAVSFNGLNRSSMRLRRWQGGGKGSASPLPPVRACAAGFECSLRSGGGGVCEACRLGQYCPRGTANPFRIAGLNPCPSEHACPNASVAVKGCGQGYLCAKLGDAAVPIECGAALTLLERSGFSPLHAPALSEVMHASTLDNMLEALLPPESLAALDLPPLRQDEHSDLALVCHGRTLPRLCPSGYYCPNTTTQLPCPERYFCPSGSRTPTRCPSLPILGSLGGCAERTEFEPLIASYSLPVAGLALLVCLAVMGRPRLWRWLKACLRAGRHRRFEDEDAAEATAASAAECGATTAVGDSLSSGEDGEDSGDQPSTSNAEQHAESGAEAAAPGGSSPVVQCKRRAIDLAQASSSLGLELTESSLATGAPAAGHGGGDLAGAAASGARVSFEMHDLSVRYGRGERATHALRGITARLPSASLNAIMGESGSGKSTLLDALCGRAALRRGVDVSGELLCNGHPQLPPAGVSGWLPQEDVLLPTLTVRENLMFSAGLRLPRGHTVRARRARVQRVLNLLRLTHVSERQVRTGLSGGERRRTCLGVELACAPLALILDEPTTGLDAANALLVSRVLHSFAAAGGTVVVSIHQPRHELFTQLGTLLLLCRGRLVYGGPAAEAISYFCDRLHFAPPTGAHADFLIDVSAGCIRRRLPPAVDSGGPRKHADAAASALPVDAVARAPLGAGGLDSDADRVSLLCAQEWAAVLASESTERQLTPVPTRGNLSWVSMFAIMLHRQGLQRWRRLPVLLAAVGGGAGALSLVGVLCSLNARLAHGTPPQNAALLVAAIVNAITIGLDALGSLKADIPFLRREALGGVRPSAWMVAKFLVDGAPLPPIALAYAAALADAAQLHAPLAQQVFVLGAHGFACSGIATLLAVCELPAAELLCSLALLLFGGILNGVAILELGALEPAGLAPILWPAPARWFSEAALGIEAAHAPRGASGSWLIRAYMRRNHLATALLDGHESSDAVLWWAVSAMMIIGLAMRAAALCVPLLFWEVLPRHHGQHKAGCQRVAQVIRGAVAAPIGRLTRAIRRSGIASRDAAFRPAAPLAPSVGQQVV